MVTWRRRGIRVRIGSVLLLIACAGSAAAATRTWIGPSGGTWSVTTIWQPNGTPQLSDDLIFPVPGGPATTEADGTSWQVSSIQFWGSWTVNGAASIEVTGSGAILKTGDGQLSFTGDNTGFTAAIEFQQPIAGPGGLIVQDFTSVILNAPARSSFPTLAFSGMPGGSLKTESRISSVSRSSSRCR